MAKIRRDRLYVRDYGQVESGKAMLLTFVWNIKFKSANQLMVMVNNILLTLFMDIK
jgi:hypothetical protein